MQTKNIDVMGRTDWLNEFVRQVIEAAKEGYKLIENDSRFYAYQHAGAFSAYVTLAKGGDTPDTVETVVETGNIPTVVLESEAPIKTLAKMVDDKTAKKDDLLALIDLLGIEVPDNKRHLPAALRKIAKEFILANDTELLE